MKRTMFAILFAATAAGLSAGTVESVLVRQMWPWSTDILVEYALSGVDAAHPVSITLKAFNGGTEIGADTLARATTGNRYCVTEPVGTLKIDPVAAFGSETVALGSFSVQLSLSDATGALDDVLYKIVDLDAPYAVVDVTRADLISGKYGSYATQYDQIDPEFSTTLSDVMIWTGVTNNTEYLTNKMVFRRIPAGGKTYMYQEGNPDVNGGAGVEVSFTKDFYMAVFETTQTQYKKFFNITPYESYPAPPCTRAHHPIKPDWIRPSTWSALDEGGIHAISTVTTLCGKMQDATGLLVDAPTEAGWEFACRAGTTGELYTGAAGHSATASDGHVLKIMRANLPYTTDKTLGLEYNAGVPGEHLPNAFGLYDMLGNVFETCMDGYSAASARKSGTDPIWSTSGTVLTANGSTAYKHTARGGFYGAYDGETECTPRIIPADNKYSRQDNNGSSDWYPLGARLCIYLDHDDSGAKNK